MRFDPLEQDRVRTRKKLESLRLQDPFAHSERINDNAASDTEASEESDHDRIAAQIIELEEHMTELESALARIDDGSYGVCVSCGANIEEARLTVVPTTIRCMRCQAAL